MKKLYEFSWDCGRMGEVSGLFIAEEVDILKALGKEVSFGEILGKHSDVYGTLENKDISIKTDDQKFIKKFISIMGEGTIFGYNPLEYIHCEECGETSEYCECVDDQDTQL